MNAVDAEVEGLERLELLEAGFRRTGPPADPIRWTALRARLSGAALGQARTVRQGLALFHSWQNASSLAAALFPPGRLRDTAASRRALRRSLRTLGTQPVSLGDLDLASHSQRRGTPVRVTGRIVKAREKVLSHIWFRGETTDNNVRRLVEEGHDFFLSDGTGQGALVIAAGGYLIGGAGASLDAHDVIEVFGFLDWVAGGDRFSAPLSGSRHPRGEPSVLALRSGDDLPLVVRKIDGQSDVTPDGTNDAGNGDLGDPTGGNAGNAGSRTLR